MYILLVCTSLTCIHDIYIYIYSLYSLVQDTGIYFHVYLRSKMKWLMGVPAGLKLNHELAESTGNLVILCIEREKSRKHYSIR